MVGTNIDLQSQIEQLINIIMQNKPVYNVIKNAQKLNLMDYYIGAGCITQTIWNYQMGNDLMYGISDIDLVYFDNTDLSYEAEDQVINDFKNILNSTDIKIDIKNQARVHIWYKEHFGYDIKAYASVEEAINTWPTTATSIGVRLETDNVKVYAPFGLNDMFKMIVRANKTQITQEVFVKKCEKWKTIWPALTIIPW